MPLLRRKGLYETGRVIYLHPDVLHPNPNQPRKRFSPDGLEELAASIREHGVLQPLTVRKVDGSFELVSGERRLRAARMAGLSEVPCIVIDVDGVCSSLLALVENVTFHMPDTIEAQRLVAEQKQRPFADCELWGPIAYDLILSQEAARLKDYDCPWSGGGFDGIIAPDLSTANTLVKSWLIHAHAVTCGAVVGAKVPIALTSRSANEEETYLSLVFCAVLDAWRKKNRSVE